MENEGINFEADGASERAAAGNATEQLSRVSAMADKLIEAQREVMRIEEDLRDAERELNDISRSEFPELMKEVGLTSIKLGDGRGLQLNDDFSCGITDERRAAAFRWLRDNKFDGLIKTELTMEFARGEGELVKEIRQLIHDHCVNHSGALRGRSPDVKESVHYQTLKSFIKEQQAAGKPVPADIFGVFPFDEVLMVYPKNFPGAVKFKRVYGKKEKKK